MGKNWWRQATGLSNAQRQASRKLGIPLSGRPSRRKLFPAKGGRNSSAGCVILLLALLTALGSVIAIGCSPAPNATTISAKPADPERIIVGDLFAAYSKNPIDADRKYKNKWLRVTGFSDIVRDWENRNVVALEPCGDYWPNVVGYIPDRNAAQFTKLPVKIVVDGYCVGRRENTTSYNGFSVVLLECEVVR